MRIIFYNYLSILVVPVPIHELCGAPARQAAMLPPAGEFNARQVALLEIAQQLFILNQVSNFPLYYMPGLRGLLNGDGDACKFPCSISWMTRRGLPRWSTLVLWNFGWFCMLFALAVKEDAAFSLTTAEWWRFFLLLQMYAFGFITVVLTPIKGPDVPLGALDKYHSFAAMIYVAYHAVVLQCVLGVYVLTTAYGLGFTLTSILCGVCQYLRTDDDRPARLLYTRFIGTKRVKFSTVTNMLEVGFMVMENALFFIFLFGMCSGLRVVPERS